MTNEERPDTSREPNPASPYAGRWVARLRGRIVAQGGTPQQALRAAQKSRHKERLEIVFMPIPFTVPPLVEKVRDRLPEGHVHLVGGAVRDMFLGRLAPDLDFAVPANGISVGRRVANALGANFMVLDEDRDTGRVIVAQEGRRIHLDFATYRGATLEADLLARDFTVNAIAYDLRTGTLMDPLNGVSDIRAGIIRACSGTSLEDDPARILRAVRQAAAFGFKIEPRTRTAMKKAAGALGGVSPERLRDELFRILEGAKPDASVRALDLLGVFPHLLPELPALKGVAQSPPHVSDVWEHTLSVLGYLEGILDVLASGSQAPGAGEPLLDLLVERLGGYQERLAEHFDEPLNSDRSLRAALFFAALYHDVAKPATRSVDEAGRIRFLDHDLQGARIAAARARAFNLSNDEVERISTIVKHHMRFHFLAGRLENQQESPSRRAIYRYFRDAGAAGIDLVLLGLADLRGTRGPTLTQEAWSGALDLARILLENYWEKPDESVAPRRLLDGNELMQELALEPGRLVGQLLEAIREAQAMGLVTSREQALDLARAQMQASENAGTD